MSRPKINMLHRSREQGFTLILSIFLLSILLSLGVAFGLLVALQTKSSNLKVHVLRARENARTAMNQGLQTIQEFAGPDQRVTARGEIYSNGIGDPDPSPASSSQASRVNGMNIGRQYYTGVWRSTTTSKEPMKWLVSTQPSSGSGTKDLHTHPDYLSKRDYATTLEMDSDPDFVKLVSKSGKKLFSKLKEPLSGTVDDSIRLWKSPVKEGSKGSDRTTYRDTGHYAWWVGDEGVKARVNLGFGKIQEWVNKPAPTNEYEFKRPTPFTAAFNYGFQGISGLSNLYAFRDQLEDVPTLHSLIPLKAASSDQVKRIFHDASVATRGVLADVRNGGLKHDLTAALFQDNEYSRFITAQSKFKDRSRGNNLKKAHDRIFDPLLLGGTNGDRTGENPGGPRWDQLRSFARLYENVNPNGTAFDTTDDFVPIRDHTDSQHGIAPILTRLQIFFTSSWEATGVTRPCKINGQTESRELYRHQFHVLPAVVLWNPYDIRIEPSDFTVIFWRNTFPHTGGGYTNQCFGDRVEIEGAGNYYVPIRYKHKLSFKIRNTGFEAGEAKVFSPQFHKEYNPYDSDGTGNLLHEGWRPGHSFYTPYYTKSHTSLDWSKRVTASEQTGAINQSKLKTRGKVKRDKKGKITDESDAVYLDEENKEIYATNTRLRVRYRIYNTRRGGFVLYSQDIPEDAILPVGQTSARGQSKNPNDPAIDTNADPIQYMKKLRTSGNNPPWVTPPVFNASSTRPLVFDAASPDPTNNSPRDYTLLWGKKYFMRFVENEGHNVYFPRKGLKKVRWLGDFNPRSNSFGRTPGEWNFTSTETTVACFRTGVINSGSNSYQINTEFNSDLSTDSPFIGYSEQTGSTRCVLFEIPRNENFLTSIGQLMHCNFTADYGNKSSKEYFRTGIGMREYFSDNIGPAYALGNSLTPVWLTPPNQNRNYQRFDVRDNSTPYGGWLYDKSYLLNDALWDRFYFSGVSSGNSMGYFVDSSGVETEYNPFDKAASRHVPGTFNPRIGYFWGAQGMPLPSKQPNSDWQKMGARIRKFDLAAGHLAVEGSFNVNSTSVDAWRALLSSFWASPHQMSQIFGIDSSLLGNEFESGSPFLRTHGVYTNQFRGKPSAGVPPDDSTSPSAYTGYRKLHQAEIDMLAQKIVQLVKRHGPFKSLSEFINRNLNSTNEWRYKGILQQAIDTTRVFNDSDGDGSPDGGGSSTYRINERFFDDDLELVDTANGSNNHYNINMLNRDVTNRVVSTGVPGYLTQADLLARLGHVVNVRSDTFIIRAYGDSTSPGRNHVMRSEVCEAVIQRFPEYFDEINESHKASTYGDDLQASNKRMGRKFRVVAFRWLSPEEI